MNNKRSRDYDSRCRDLAEVFLAEAPQHLRTERNAEELAVLIQRTIEDYVAFDDGPGRPVPNTDRVA